MRTAVRRVIGCVFAAVCLVVAGVVAVAAPSHAATTTTISANGSSAGLTFGGIGAISGGGGNSRLLTDYPAAEQQQILDYLFKPDYGADLQILKVEIGGDTNSTDGSESSIEHTSGAIKCSSGYEWWLMEQAKALNPSIKLYGLAWGAPGWVGSFWTTATINYLVSWLNCATSHGLTINYLGGWNERATTSPGTSSCGPRSTPTATRRCRSSGPTATGRSPPTSPTTRRSPARSRSSACTIRAPAATAAARTPARPTPPPRAPGSRSGPARTDRRTSTAARARSSGPSSAVTPTPS